MQRRSARSLLAAASALFLTASSLLAAPPLLQQLPDNAGVVITIPNPQGMERSLQALTTAVEIPIPPVGVADLLAMAGFMDGVAPNKALAVAFLFPADPAAELPDDPEEMLVVLLPVTNYADFVANLDADAANAGDDGVLEATSPDGQTVFVRDLKNGYAALAQSRAVLRGYKPGKADAITSRAGAMGNALLDKADLVTVFNVDVLRPFMNKAVDRAKAEAKERMADLPMGAQAGPDLDSPLINWMQQTLTRDTRMLVGGLKLSSMGVSLDMSASFIPNSYLAGVFGTEGASGQLFRHLPSSQPYLLALALDTSSPALKRFFSDFTEKLRASARDGEEMPEGFFGAPLGAGDGQSALIGFNPGLIMGAGLMTSAVSYTKSSNPDAVVDATKQAILNLNGFDNDQLTISTKFAPTPNPVGSAKIPADAWEVRMTPRGGNLQAAQGLNWIFGPTGGPSGYVAKAPHGVFTTYARNSILLTAAMQAAESGNHLAADQMITQVGGILPPGRMAEIYLGTKSIVDLAVPALAMFTGTQIDPALIPEQIPPVAAAIASKAGEAQFSIFVPAPVIKVGAAVAQKLRETQTRFEQMGAPGDADDDDDDPTGQPRF
ncbi:MAG: hypothetical protein KF768_07060 [Phycisphaeraceae bacterium]|nr:hypothetical protein [Phycisphaeraceae bacterium]